MRHIFNIFPSEATCCSNLLIAKLCHPAKEGFFSCLGLQSCLFLNRKGKTINIKEKNYLNYKMWLADISNKSPY